MMSNMEKLQHGECCCCLDKGDHRDLTKQYYLDKQLEIYEVLFKDTFGIVLKYPENTKLICDYCIVELKQASYFRNMVESTQQKLRDPNVAEGLFNIEDIKIKCESDDHVEKVFDETGDQQVKEETCDQLMEEPHNIDEMSMVDNLDNKDLFSVKEERFIGGNVTYEFSTLEESYNNVQQVSTIDNPDIKTEISDLATTSRIKLKTLRVSIPAFTVEQLLSYYDQQRTLSRRSAKLPDKSYSCDLCQYKTAKKENVKVHLRSHTSDKSKCQFKTAGKKNLKSHMSSHTGEKQFSCDMCQYKTAGKGNLVQHKRTHTRSRQLSLTQPSESHIRSYTGGRQLSCDICQFKTPQKEILREHLYTHTARDYFEVPTVSSVHRRFT